jgi:sec-independent protein translocase protein TatA
MGSMSIVHWILVLLVVALLFGPSRLGQIGRGLGDGIRNLRKGLAGEEDDTPAPAAPPTKKLEGDSSTKN